MADVLAVSALPGGVFSERLRYINSLFRTIFYGKR